MRRFASFVKKEFIHIFRDRVTMLILFLMPIVMIVLFSYAVTTEVKCIQTAVLDLSGDFATRKIITALENDGYFQITRILRSPNELQTVFNDGKINLAVVFSENFAESLHHGAGASLQLLADGTEANSAAMYVNYAQGVLRGCLLDFNRMDGAAPVINTNVKMLYNPSGKSEYNFVPGVMGLMLLLINAMMTSVSIVREKERGTMEMLLASPLPPFQIILAKLAPYFTVSAAVLAIILLFSRFMLGVPIAGNIFLLLGLCLLYIFVALALGLLISTIVNSQLAAMLASGMVLMMPTMLLSGLMFPIESMPKILQWLSCIVPARWFIAALKKVMIQGVGFENAITEFAVLGFMAAFYVALSLKKFKFRL